MIIRELRCEVMQVCLLTFIEVHSLARHLYQDLEHCGAEFWGSTMDGRIAAMPAAWQLRIVPHPEMAAVKATQLRSDPATYWAELGSAYQLTLRKVGFVNYCEPALSYLLAFITTARAKRTPLGFNWLPAVHFEVANQKFAPANQERQITFPKFITTAPKDYATPLGTWACLFEVRNSTEKRQ